MNTISPNAPVLCLAGPTASGKTALAIELAQRYPLRLISVDSAQVYRGLDIGTGKPEPEVLARAPHRLIDIRDPAETYSASDFCRDARREIAAARDEGKLPFLVGGTMLYFKALRDGLADMPDADPVVRAEIEALAQAEGWESVHRELERVDPDSAARIHPNDPQRLQRALEIYRISGRTMTDLHAQEAHDEAESPLELEFFAIQPPDRRVLHGQIADRFHDMLARGLLDEVRALHARNDLKSTLPSMKSVGYRQVWQYLDGELSYEEMVEKSIIATRQLAKRQLTWLRGWKDLQTLENSSVDEIVKTLEIRLNCGDYASI